MKKTFFTSALLFLVLAGSAQQLAVSYSQNYTCSSELFFAVRSEINGNVQYRLTVFKTASPGATVYFDLDKDMSDKYMSAVDFTDPTRPMFGGAVGDASGSAVFYDTEMGIGSIKLIQDQSLCATDSKKIYLTRNGEFHFVIADDSGTIPTGN